MILKAVKRRIRKILGIKAKHGSETTKVRPLVIGYCEGFGCDIGFGGDKIKKESCIGIDFATPYAFAGDDKVDIACNVGKEPIPVESNYFDYVYSSHLIEDFEDTAGVLSEFIRILKSGGNLILVFPDQQEYEKVCRQTGQPLNTYHVHSNMGFTYMMNCLEGLKAKQHFGMELLYKSDRAIDYNVVMVLKITKG